LPLSGVFLNKAQKYIPLIETIRNYKKEYAKKDLIASLTVAIVAIPQSMAYAIIAGVNPVYGLYTSIVSAIFGSAFGCSNHMITGPTNAISLLIASSMRRYMGLGNAYELLFLMTFTVGILQLFFGLIKLGKAINYVSHAVIVGFTAGAGILIALGQLNQLLGISIMNSAQMPAMSKLYYVITHLNESNIFSLGLGLLTIAVIIICKKINKNLPGSLIGIIIPIVLIIIFDMEKQGVKLVGSIPSSLPPFKMVQFSFDSIKSIFSGAVAIAIIGLVEAISISKSISSTSRQKIDADQEFIGQGMANIAASFFQCIAGSGSFTRSAINYYSGAVTRLSGIFSGVLVAIVLMFMAPYAKYIPMPCLSGVIMVIAYNMVNKNEMKKVYKIGKSDFTVMWVTFGATVLMPDLDWAIYMGIAISIALYLRDTNKVPVKILIPLQNNESKFIEKEIEFVRGKVDILIIQLEGNLYFGSASDLENKLETLVSKSKVFILRMKQVVTVDITSLDAIRIFIRSVKETGGTIIICGVKSGLNSMLMNSDIVSDIGAENIFLSEDQIFASSTRALERAKNILKNEKKEDLSTAIKPVN
jgi:SulP family sulfate permease